MSKEVLRAMSKEERQENFEFFMEDFIESYRKYHEKEETICLIKDMLIQKNIAILPEYLKIYGHRGISYHLIKAIESKKDSDIYDKYELAQFEKEIEIAYDLLKKWEKENLTKKKNYSLKRFSLYGTITAISLATTLHFSSTAKGDICNVDLSHSISNQNNNYKVVKVVEPEEDKKICNSVITEHKIRNIEVRKLSKEEIQKKKLKHKMKVLNKYKKLGTIRNIKFRQKELENLKLTKEDKLYKDCPLSPALQQFIYEQSIINKIPVDLTFSIIHTETRGEFNSSGEKYYNSSTNYDLGLTQQNSVYRVPVFAEKYGLSQSEACDLVQYNDYINIICTFLEYAEINGQLDSYNPYEFAGLYNGWIDWRNNEISQEYVKIFTNAYDNIYTKHHEVEKNKILSKSKKNK